MSLSEPTGPNRPMDEALSNAKPVTAQTDDWPVPDMSVLREGRKIAPEPPLHLFGDVIEKQIRDIAASKGAPPDYVMANFLSATASLVGNARWVEAWPGWREPCAIWTCLVGGPSAGKSPASEPMQRLLAVIEAGRSKDFHDAIRKHAAEAEKAKLATESWREAAKAAHDAGNDIPPKPEEAYEPDPPTRPRALVMDITTEELAMILKANPKGILQFRDEMSGFLAGHGRYGNDADRPFYLEAYGGRTFTVDRRKNDQPIVIPYLTLSISGGIQPDKLNSLLLKGDDDGLSSRFLYFWPDPIRPIMPDHDFDLSTFNRVFEKLEKLEMDEEDGKAKPSVMVLAEPGILLDWVQKLHEEEANASGVYGSFIGKLRGVCVRLSGLFELLNWAVGDNEKPPSDVSLQSLQSAITLIDTYIIFMSKRVFSDAAIPEDERRAALVAGYIDKNRIQTFNARKARQQWGLSDMREAQKFDEALAYLEEAGWVRRIETRQGKTKGRRAKNYEANPAIF